MQVIVPVAKGGIASLEGTMVRTSIQADICGFDNLSITSQAKTFAAVVMCPCLVACVVREEVLALTSRKRFLRLW